MLCTYIVLNINDFIYRHSKEESLPRIMDLSKGTLGTLQEQMFHNRKTLREITEMREDITEDKVISFCF